ncbi:MAG: ABC transporter permease [Chloroflexi bacterium]|jgi:ABC-2 type transport system permease protein|nr:ABC transporter permease [Chloroflexota bacterium]
MRKLWILILKEIRLTFRDRGLIITMLVTPLVITLVIAGAFGNGGSGLSDIPVILINKDEGFLSEELVNVFAMEGVTPLVQLEVAPNSKEAEAAARARVESDDVAVLVIIPSDLTSRLYPFSETAQEILGVDFETWGEGETPELTEAEWQALSMAYVQSQIQTPAPSEPAEVVLYASPDWRISTMIVKSIVTQGLTQLQLTTQGYDAIVSRIIRAQMASGDLSMSDQDNAQAELADTFAGFGGSQGAAELEQSYDLPIRLRIKSPSGRGFSWLSYSAASQAMLFLMFAITSGGRTLLAEQEGGTLPRLLITPNPPLTILLGKMAGIAVTGLMQMLLLWGATSLVGAYWGAPVAVAISMVVLVLCASGLGAFISAWAQSPGQAGAVGTAFSLVAAALSGTFVPRPNMPAWGQTVSLVTPNAWGIEIFSNLQNGKSLQEILPLLGGALALTVGYYILSLIGFRRQFK